jgi:glycosyltransferase involved in cell wall biosynthesis
VSGLSISVVVIARNAARTIGEALASVERSSLVPLEVLVVDGNSTDGTPDFAARFALARVIAQAGTGIANAYNEGIAAARGELISFLSADDRWLPEKLARHAALHAERPGLLASVSHVMHFLDGQPPPNSRADLIGRAVPGFLMEALVARPAAFARVGGFDPRFSTAEDTDWFARAVDAGIEIAVIPEVLVEKRQHAGNTSLGDTAGAANRLRALRGTILRKRSTPSNTDPS